MATSFVRTLWGVYDNTRRFYRRRQKMDDDIKLLLRNPFNQPFRTYVFGDDNLKFLQDRGVTDCVLVDKRPYIWDMDTQQFRHKLEAFRLGMQDFDKIVFLDWDCQPIKPLPAEFWTVLDKKQPIQAILRSYRNIKASWRSIDKRKIPCASFVYIRDKQIPYELIKIWEKNGSGMSEEIPMMQYMESVMGGWKGTDVYWQMFEPDFFVLDEGFVYPPETLATKNKCFAHFNIHAVSRQLRQAR